MMTNTKILVVDDEPDLCNILKFNLEDKGYDVDVAYSAEQALEKELNSYSLILLDVMMQDISGIEMVSILRNERSIDVPVIFLSAMTNEENILDGLKIGADDYIKKPFSLNELVARVNTVISRYHKNTIPKEYKAKGLTFDDMRKQVLIDRQPIGLSLTEYQIFTMLYNYSGKVYSRDQILCKVWPDQDYISGRTVDVNVTRIRKKLGYYGKCVCTRSGYGYYFDERKAFEAPVNN
ncbi:MAG: response regulator transcription factor [Salinivirgaceae bacterium]|jgi:two-component system alkaline phosphatase synthesis response regulator PhoP|nr:response regulator transcription factor [Salinivirgaceae bacterium]